jgi:excisionase family DNA binding protein
MINPGGLLYVNVVAELLNCSKQHVYNLIHRGDLEAVKLGKRAGFRIVRASLMQFMEKNRYDEGA